MVTEKTLSRVSVVGAGAWGTVLANLIARTGRDVTLIARDEKTAATIEADRENARRLPGTKLADGVLVTARNNATVDAYVYAAPAQHAREHFDRLSSLVTMGASTPVVIASKGIEVTTGRFLWEVLEEVWPTARPFVLSGPTFAHDIAAGLPAAATLAGKTSELLDPVRDVFSAPAFRLYPSTDLMGVSLGGAAKNVLAIAAGVASGAGLGESARAAIIARGFAEVRRLGVALGVADETLQGLSGLGDLILTATSPASRNTALGMRIGKGASVKDALAQGTAISEGVKTATAILLRAQKNNVEMPVCSSVVDLLSEKRPLTQIVEELLRRPPSDEAG